MIEYIERSRAKFGAAPRKFSALQCLYNRIQPPVWMKRRDPLLRIYKDQKLLFTDGFVVWGQIIQANRLLYSPGFYNCPAVLLYSLDPYFDEYLDDLQDLALGLYDLKGTQVEDEEIALFVEAITDEYQVLFNKKLPRSLTDDREIYYTTVMVHRKHLPGRYLQDTLLPLLVKPEATDACIILPSRYWDAELAHVWTDEAEAEEAD